MSSPRLTRSVERGVALLGDDRRPGGVTFAFTERTGGVSEGAYASLNLCVRQGDDASAVAENRSRALAALGLDRCADRLVNPLQVHGTDVVTIGSGDPESLAAARAAAEAGADAVVCTVPDVPVMLLSADCALVALVCQGAFALAHSGWRGTIGEISARALEELCRATGADPKDVWAYVGPRIGRDDYEVSDELARRFAERFGADVVGPGRTLDLGACILRTLDDAGVGEGQVAMAGESTASHTDRFFSWRAQGGVCGRQAAIACVVGTTEGSKGGAHHG